MTQGLKAISRLLEGGLSRRAFLAGAGGLALTASVGRAFGQDAAQTLIVAWPNGAEGVDLEFNVHRR